jgi:serine/threonine-protein kinase
MISAPELGEHIGRYRVDRLVARGGMASIFQGTDEETGHRVAIKIPNPEMEVDVLFFDRFQRESDIGRKLEHPGVVKVFPKEDTGRVCMVMEWVDGRRLREILDEQKSIPEDRAVQIALRVCEILEYVHAHGVVHRDLKPDNLIIDAEDRVKLLDFGIARQEGARRLTFLNFTKAMGTPDYASPEQVKGKRGDARSDVYALGVIFFEMLAGQVPFLGSNALTAMNQKLLSPAPRVREINPEISTAIDEILSRALERDPQNRYASAHDFAWDLQHQDKVGVAERREPAAPASVWATARRRGFSWAYMALALIPAIIFTLLFFVAKQK